MSLKIPIIAFHIDILYLIRDIHNEQIYIYSSFLAITFIELSLLPFNSLFIMLLSTQLKFAYLLFAYWHAQNYYGNVNLGNWIEISMESIWQVDEKLSQANPFPFKA